MSEQPCTFSQDVASIVQDEQINIPDVLTELALEKLDNPRHSREEIQAFFTRLIEGDLSNQFQWEQDRLRENLARDVPLDEDVLRDYVQDIKNLTGDYSYLLVNESNVSDSIVMSILEWFIVFTGPNCSGKTNLVKGLTAALNACKSGKYSSYMQVFWGGCREC